MKFRSSQSPITSKFPTFFGAMIERDKTRFRTAYTTGNRRRADREWILDVYHNMANRLQITDAQAKQMVELGDATALSRIHARKWEKLCATVDERNKGKTQDKQEAYPQRMEVCKFLDADDHVCVTAARSAFSDALGVRHPQAQVFAGNRDREAA